MGEKSIESAPLLLETKKNPLFWKEPHHRYYNSKVSNCHVKHVANIINHDDIYISKPKCGTALAVQWLGLGTLTVKRLSVNPGQGTKIPQAGQHSQK